MAPSATQAVGRRAEQCALRYLESHGLTCLRRNFNCRVGEIDLIMQYRLGIAMMGLAVIAVGLLARPIAPDWSAHNRSAVAMMVIGGIILVLLPTLAAAIVGP